MPTIMLWILIVLSVVNIAVADLQYTLMQDTKDINRKILVDIDERVNSVQILMGRLSQK
jgi:hypothetical protein